MQPQSDLLGTFGKAIGWIEWVLWFGVSAGTITTVTGLDRSPSAPTRRTCSWLAGAGPPSGKAPSSVSGPAS